MRRITMLIPVLGLLAALTVTALAQDKSLYERLGGKDAIKAVVDDFAGRAGSDERLSKKFARSDGERVKVMLVEQICMVTGGPCKYTGRDMKTAHHHMGVTEGEFNALVEDLVATLNKFNVPEREKTELLNLLAPLKSQIVEVKSSATGTPLPDNFKPAAAAAGGGKMKGDKMKDKNKEKTKP